MIQIRGVPEDLHRLLKARAARHGMGLSEFIKWEFGAYGRPANYAGVARTNTAGQADSGETKRRSDHPRLAGITVIAREPLVEVITRT